MHCCLCPDIDNTHIMRFPLDITYLLLTKKRPSEWALSSVSLPLFAEFSILLFTPFAFWWKNEKELNLFYLKFLFQWFWFEIIFFSEKYTRIHASILQRGTDERVFWSIIHAVESILTFQNDLSTFLEIFSRIKCTWTEAVFEGHF